LHSSKTMNYSAQEAVKDFYEKPLALRIHLVICYEVDAPPDALRIKVIQNRKEITPRSYQSSQYYPATDKYSQTPSIGEEIELEFKGEQFDSSTVTIVIDTPDGQHSETDIELTKLR
jgi:hypothetical protein